MSFFFFIVTSKVPIYSKKKNSNPKPLLLAQPPPIAPLTGTLAPLVKISLTVYHKSAYGLILAPVQGHKIREY